LRAYEGIQFYEYLNEEAGQPLLLKEEHLNPIVWPIVMERAKQVSVESRGICTEADLIFHLVRGGPALLF
jgi:hypothetical protein